MLKSLRRRPEEPPSSVTVTTAARSEIEAGSAAGLAGDADMAAESAQQRGEAGAAADGHHAQRAATDRHRMLQASCSGCGSGSIGRYSMAQNSQQCH